MASGFPWHRVFHPLCGADPLTLAELVVRRGPPSWRGMPAYGVALATALARVPFTLADRVVARRREVRPPVFIVGHPRSGTTHLHNIMAASGAFGTVPPVTATLPWESRTMAPLIRPFIDPFLPETRLIDSVELSPDAPTEDEVGLANLGGLSYFHAIYFPSRFARDYRDGLLGEGPERRVAARRRAIRRYVGAMAGQCGEPLLLKNPAYTATPEMLLELFPGARIVHIRRDPRDVFASTRRMLRRVLGELALQDIGGVDVEAAILETYPRVMARWDAARERVPAAQVAEVAFEEVVEAPEAVLTRLWEALDLPGGAAEMERMRAYLDSVSGYRPSENRLSGEETALLARVWPRQMAGYGAAAGE
ncbi:sulfotransferase family protein [Tranquillimonas alkanivorans]|uniref:Sulfotransferase family protein n=1 Tax=Tranquillimonas alkanivorans TaxID=441119 RepID=A0A1I5QSA6_9RHOB|nr:sulfotransferase [Tranquillimonas alkanivorans]SFP49103.1 Sulfotransferase family protein [Tranquillimonas alkanivorans]